MRGWDITSYMPGIMGGGDEGGGSGWMDVVIVVVHLVVHVSGGRPSHSQCNDIELRGYGILIINACEFNYSNVHVPVP